MVISGGQRLSAAGPACGSKILIQRQFFDFRVSWHVCCNLRHATIYKLAVNARKEKLGIREAGVKGNRNG